MSNPYMNTRLKIKMQNTSCANNIIQYSTLESEMKREISRSGPDSLIKQLNLPNQLYTVNINFDEASDEWHANKKRVGHNYVYICNQTIIKTGNKCGKVCYKDGLTCFIHKNRL